MRALPVAQVSAGKSEPRTYIEMCVPFGAEDDRMQSPTRNEKRTNAHSDRSQLEISRDRYSSPAKGKLAEIMSAHYAFVLA